MMKFKGGGGVGMGVIFELEVLGFTIIINVVVRGFLGFGRVGV